ncbi:MAG: nitrilase-related carbon-nitrogen hydrolase, partial [Burkholderiales bacterium]
MKIALAQINPTVGDFNGNLEKIIAATRRGADQGARLAVFSELAICGYPPADFLEKPSFLKRCRSAVDELATATRDLPTAVIAGVALPAPPDAGKPAVNAAVLLDCGHLLLEQHKRLLPFYDVFDEQRYFLPTTRQQVVELDGLRLAISICEDAWNDKNFWPRRLYSLDPLEELMRQNPSIHINLSSSPFWHSKRKVRRQMLAAIANRDGIPVLMCNQVGGNDSLIFDGSSLVLNKHGDLVAQAKSFAEDLVIVDPFCAPPVPDPADDDTEAAYQALVLGTRDYVRKCGFSKVLIALSGGIDSALVAAIAADALGSENVLAIGMPSPYSSQ